MRIIVTTILLLLGITTAFAQPRGKGKSQMSSEKIESYRVAFFTQKLDLTESESKAFWPVYNAYQKELKKIRSELRTLGKSNYSEMSDKELEATIEKRFKLQEKKLTTERLYYKKFKKVLPMKKVANLPQVERAFKSALLKRMREQRKEKRQK